MTNHAETDLVTLTAAICAARSLNELERAFASLGPLLSVPMFGFYTLEPGSETIEMNVGINVSDDFVARYRDKMQLDPLIEASRSTASPAYNLDLMSTEAWLESDIYRHAYATHSMLHVVETPILYDGETVGALHLAANDATRDIASTDLRLVESVGYLLGSAIARIRRDERTEAELAHALAALDMTNTAVAWSTAAPTDPPQLNDPAKRLVDEVVDGERHINDLRARPPLRSAFTRRAEVELRNGKRAILVGRSGSPTHVPGLVTVIEVQAEHPHIPPQALIGLTPREAEIAGLVAEGLTDREIAQHLALSHYTVSQHVREIYRKLGVGSRVALTRLLLTTPTPRRS